MNKYGGINDMPSCDKRVYGLWFQMLRRCYDTEQQKRSKGKSYAGCEVSERWKRLSNFAKDIKHLDGYEDWLTHFGYCLDKDLKGNGSRVYSRGNCCFVPQAENIREIKRRHPNITKAASEANKVVYVLKKDGVTLVFDSEGDACKYLGVKKCSVSSCYHKGYKCKGHHIEREGAKMDLEVNKNV